MKPSHVECAWPWMKGPYSSDPPLNTRWLIALSSRLRSQKCLKILWVLNQLCQWMFQEVKMNPSNLQSNSIIAVYENWHNPCWFWAVELIEFALRHELYGFIVTDLFSGGSKESELPVEPHQPAFDTICHFWKSKRPPNYGLRFFNTKNKAVVNDVYQYFIQ